MAKILCGKTASNDIRSGLKKRVDEYKKRTGSDITLSIIQGGNRSDSNQYVGNKTVAAKNMGVGSNHIKISEHEEDYYSKLYDSISQSLKCSNGVILQVPVPGLNKDEQEKLIESISCDADVDSMTKEVVMKFYSNTEPSIVNTPCTPAGIMRLLEYYNIDVCGKKVVIIGRSEIVGRPLAHLMQCANATVTVCHSKTSKDDICKFIGIADMIVCAIGNPEYINSKDFSNIDWSDKILIDVGTNRVNDVWLGDISQEIKDMSFAYSPVPGGVGPMTITTLLEKVVINADNQ